MTSKIKPVKAKLKPCPFCGGKAILEQDRIAYWITCDGCFMGSFGSTSKTDVVKAWNKRVKP